MARDAMLVDLVQVFSRLHQVEKFMQAMLAAARTVTSRTYLDGEFLKRQVSLMMMWASCQLAVVDEICCLNRMFKCWTWLKKARL